MLVSVNMSVSVSVSISVICSVRVRVSVRASVRVSLSVMRRNTDALSPPQMTEIRRKISKVLEHHKDINQVGLSPEC